MSAYLVAQIQVENPEVYQQYADGFRPTIQPYDGEVLAADNKGEVLEGKWVFPRTVILKFPSIDQAKAWYNSPEYKELVELRHQASKGNVILVRGLA